MHCLADNDSGQRPNAGTSVTEAKNILLTGLPGCGKTTLVRRVIECLVDLRLRGFYTQELRGADGRRVGFEAIGLHGRRTNLAHVRSQSKNRVGRYGVELRGFEDLIREELAAAGDVELFVIDEIGKMECCSLPFVDVTQQLLSSETPVLATVAKKGGGLIREVKERDDVELIPVTTENRDELPAVLARRLRSLRG